MFKTTPDIIAISETRLNSNSHMGLINIPNYTFCHANSISQAGGVGIYIKNDIHFTVRDDLEFPGESNENIWIEVLRNDQMCKNNSKRIVVGAVYRHPSSDMNDFNAGIESTLLKLQSQKCNFYVTGDFNIDLLKIKTNKDITQYCDLISSYNSQNIVTKPTRVTQSSNSLIDHFYTNNPPSCSKCFIINSDISDHFPLTVSINHSISYRTRKPTSTFVRDLKHFKAEEFCFDVEESLRKHNVEIHSVNEQTNILTNIIVSAVDKHMPLKKYPDVKLAYVQNHGSQKEY